MFSLILSGILWGTGGISGDLFGSAAGLSSLSVAAYRLLAGGLLVLVLSGARLPRGFAAWRRVIAVGVLAAAFQACYFASIAYTSVSVATLITIGAAPVLVLAAESLSGRGRADRWAAGTVCLALTGFVLLSGAPEGSFSLAGAGLALGAAAGFATMTVLSASPVSGLDDLSTTGYAFTFGGLLLFLFADTAFQPSPRSIGLLLLLGSLPTAVAYTLYFRGLRSASPTTAALIALLEPLTAAVIAAVLLGDRLTVLGLAGAALLVATVATAALTPRPAAS